ncbi:NADH-quinone oxidoreductase subunit J [Dichotomicrobium thermohalophilum]|uniref:NADH-quinone oxidoreductase subunit J n=1 Tax=Dichotomicrobium thermohalophilum TaxID=933063 RepID=A0A397Q437_9HYPH|nr:NADH-quinone oxidoreductase subunit J [Dichotomicrobium thermohalophilum]RIA56116.1 NADH dehydrogenase subunit J [Dichotomicrobium thermohalophilum]
MVAGAFFYIFSFITIASALMVITVRNPVHGVLFLILAFFNSAGLFVLLGAEFLAMILVVVYVGAVMVLFLFVVMMLDVDFAEMRAGFVKYLPIGAAVGIVLLVELSLVIGAWTISEQSLAQRAAPTPGGEVTNTEALGAILYTDYVYFFELAGVILLVAMIGAIVLTLRQREGVKRQDIAAQVARRPSEAIEVRHVEPGQGL